MKNTKIIFTLMLVSLFKIAGAEPLHSPKLKPIELTSINLINPNLKKHELDKILDMANKEQQKKIKKIEIDIEERELKIKRIFLEKPVNWEKIQEENEKIALLEAKLKTNIQKVLYEKLEDEKPVKKLEDRKPIKKLEDEKPKA